MSMSTHVVGFRAPDEVWQRMKAAYDACKEADIEPPAEVLDFFGHERPDPRGIEVKLPITDWSDTSGAQQGFELAVSDIPPQVTHIRFFNAW